MKLAKSLLATAAISTLLMTASVADEKMIAKGEKIFNTKNLGNCFACHDVNGQKIDGPGSFGPKLVGLSYWDDQLLYDTIYDIYASRDIKISAMPAFGKTGWLDDAEIKAVVAYLKTIN